MSYTFSTNIPQSAQKISATQAPIMSNFQAINELINVDHVGFNDAVNYGKHNFTTFPVQGSDPTTLSGEMAIYSKATPSGPNAAEIFYRYPSDGTVVQLTGSTSSGGAATNGYAYMSSTLFIMWGTATGIVNGSNTIVFPTTSGYPSFSSTPYQIYFSAATTYTNLTSTAPYISSSSTTQFTLQDNATNYATSIYWLALGV